MPRSRTNKNTGLETNLYRDKGRFVYRNPQTGKRTSINRTLSEANILARKANANLMKKAKDTDLLSKMIADEGDESCITFADVCDRFYNEIIETGKNKPSTKRTKKYRLATFKKDIGETPIDFFTVKKLSNYLDENFVNDAYIGHRSLLIAVFKFAIAKGIITGENPAEQTLERTRDRKARKRHTLDGLLKIIKHSEPWLQRAIKIALFTLQRREDIVEIKKTDIKNGFLYLKQNKSEGEQFDQPIYLKIHMGAELTKVVQESISSPLASPYVVHNKPQRIQRRQQEAKPHWTYVTPDYLSKAFAKARKAANPYPDLLSNEQPTFHEIRALGSWLYEHKAGYDHKYVQHLMGHSSGKMTKEYQDGHEIEYQEVGAELSLTGLNV